MIRSTGTLALWVTMGDQPGMTLSDTPVTVTVAVVALRLLVICGASRTSAPPASAMKL